MDNINDDFQTEVRNQLKVLLLYLAAKSESPSHDLQIVIREVLEELHSEVKETIKKQPHLKLLKVNDTLA